MDRPSETCLDLPADLEALRDIGPWLQSYLQTVVEDDARASVQGRSELAVHELAVNMVEHAHAASVSLEAWCENEQLIFLLTDDGQPFQGGPDSVAEPEELQVRGYGLSIIETLADEVRYERTPGHNRWWIRLPIAA